MRTAGDLALAAARIRLEAEATKRTRPNLGDFARADELDERSRMSLPPAIVEVGNGGEIAPVAQLGLTPYNGNDVALFRNTVTDGSYLAAGASRDRLQLAHEANVLETALDAAETAQADNSLEKMLAHQLAAAHHSAMKLDAQLNHHIGSMNGVISDKVLAARNVEVARLANSTARMMAAFQQGLLTLQRLKSGGHQVVTVQHVTVGEGGQAVITGQMKTGGRVRKTKRRAGPK